MTTETAEIEMRIKNNSQEIAIEAVKTIPMFSKYGFFKFLADGIQEPAWKKIDEEKQQERARYISECSKAKIIPFSEINLEYDENTKLFLPESSFYNQLISGNADSVKALLSGGRIHKIRLETNSFRYGGFKELGENFLQTLTNKKYSIQEGRFWLTCYHFTGYDEGDSPDTTLEFKTHHSKEGLTLKIGSNISEQDSEKLIGWFEKLRGYKSN